MSLIADPPRDAEHPEVQVLFEEAHQRRRHRRWTIAGCLIATTAVAFGITAGIGGFGSVRTSTGAGSGPVPSVPTPNAPLYSKDGGVVTARATNVDGRATDVSANFPFTVRFWVRSGRPIVIQTGYGAASFSSVQARAAWLAAGLQVQPTVPSVTEVGAEPLFSFMKVLDVTALPTDPRSLRRVLMGPRPIAIGIPPSWWSTGLAMRVALLLIEPSVGGSRQLDVALGRVLATATGVESLGRITSHDGHTGEGYALTTAFGPEIGTPVIVVDRSTGSVLEVQNWPADAGTPPMVNPRSSPASLNLSAEVVWMDPVASNEHVDRQSVPSPAS